MLKYANQESQNTAVNARRWDTINKNFEAKT